MSAARILAFPRPGYYPDDPQGRLEPRERLALRSEPEEGMALRDFFAAAALQGLLAFSPVDTPSSGQMRFNAAAQDAYEYADAMLARRDKR